MAHLSVFCFNCSIRLGSIVAGFVSMVQVIIPSVILWVIGVKQLQQYAKYFDDHMDEFNYEPSFEWFVKYLEKDAEAFETLNVSLSLVYVVACCLEIFGAYKLKKWFLVPFILLEACRIILLFALHCVAMMVLKKKVNLGTLIGGSVTGGFVLLYLGYIWACVVSLFQVIIIVNSAEYKMMYGNDPLAPLENGNQTNDHDYYRSAAKVEKVKIYPSPDFNANADTKSSKNTTNTSYLNASSRISQEYNLMRNQYLNKRSYVY